MAAILLVALMGVLVHRLIIEPILGSAPINQLLATGGLLFFLQSFATLLFGTDFRNVGIRLPIIELGDMDLSFARLLAFIAALLGAGGLYLFLVAHLPRHRHPRHRPGPRDDGPDGGRRAAHLSHRPRRSAAGLPVSPSCLLVLQYDVHPFIGLTFGPITFMICVLGGLGNMIGGFIAAFIISQIIAIGGYYFSVELSDVIAFVLFIVLIMIRPQGILSR